MFQSGCVKLLTQCAGGRGGIRQVDGLLTRYGLPKTEIPRTKFLERSTVGRNDVRIDRLGCRDKPRVVLAQPPGRPPLDQSAASRLREVQPLNRKPLQRRKRGSFVDRAFQELVHADDDTTTRRPRNDARNRRAGPMVPAAVSRSRSIRYSYRAAPVSSRFLLWQPEALSQHRVDPFDEVFARLDRTSAVDQRANDV